MRSWQIIAAGGAAATIGCVSLWMDDPLAQTDIASFFIARWPATVIAWSAFYGLTVLVVSPLALWAEVGAVQRAAGAALAEGGDPAAVLGNKAPSSKHHLGTQPFPQLRQIKRQWIQRFFLRLAICQYPLAVLVLLGLGFGLSRIAEPDAAQLPSFFPALVAHSVPVTAGAILVLAGLLCAAAVIALARLLERRTMLVLIMGTQLRLLRQIADVLNAQTAIAPNPEAVEFAGLIKGQRSILEAIRDLAMLINRLERTPRLTEDGSPTLSGVVDAASLDALQHASSKLMGLMETLDASLTRLGEWAASLSAAAPLSGHDLRQDAAGPLRNLSVELRELLQEINGPLPSDEQKF